MLKLYMSKISFEHKERSYPEDSCGYCGAQIRYITDWQEW